jgi:hypothetical protein
LIAFPVAKPTVPGGTPASHLARIGTEASGCPVNGETRPVTGTLSYALEDDLTVSLLQARLIELGLPINVKVGGSLGDSA